MNIELEVLQDTPPWEWPANTGKLLLGILNDRAADAEDRLFAARLAGDFVVINDALSDALMRIVSSAGEPEEVRAAAAISFGAVLDQADTFGFDDPDDVPITEKTFRSIQTTLHTIYLDESIPLLVRRRALEASVRAPDDWHSEAIARAYSSGERDLVLTAVFAMQYIQGFNTQILEALNNKDPEIHYEAVEAAGTHALDHAWPHVVRLVEDPSTEKNLRIVAIGAVAGIRPREADEILSDLTESDDEEIAEAAEEAISDANMSLEFDESDEEEEENDEE